MRRLGRPIVVVVMLVVASPAAAETFTVTTFGDSTGLCGGTTPGRNAKPETARFYAGIFRVTQPGRITQLALTEALAKCQLRPGERGRPQSEEAQAVGGRQGQVPDEGLVQLGDRARHQVARQ
jgi:hypothetical protein